MLTLASVWTATVLAAIVFTAVVALQVMRGRWHVAALWCALSTACLAASQVFGLVALKLLAFLCILAAAVSVRRATR